jgi:hypothetical protein
MTNYPASVTGDFLGLAFPPTIEMLQQQGVDFLTRAFHAAGTLARENRVKAITECTEFVGGGMGRKLLLTLQYQKPEPVLHEQLFVKFQLDFGNPLREVFGPLMQAEIRFALLSRRDDFPIFVPKCYFADYNAATTSGILITERIAYAQDGIEPRYEKCLDYKVSDLLAHYQALTRSMARLAAFHKAGRFGSVVEKEFPFDPDKVDMGNKIPYTPEQLNQKLLKLRQFVDAYPHLMPEHIRAPRFLEGFCTDVPLVLAHESRIRARLNEDIDYVALCHWNMNLDNAWFWSAGGALQAGLLDWGSVGQMSVAQAFYGMTCCAEIEFLNEHKPDLLRLFVAEYRSHGGPAIDLDRLMYLNKLSVALLGVAWMLDAPALIEANVPELSRVTDRYDAKLVESFLGRVELQILCVFLHEWLTSDIGAALREFAGSGEG